MTAAAPGDLSRLDASTTALVHTVDGLTSADLAARSLLPGWSRAHVVAHLALNGLALAAVLDALGRGEPAAMYESDQRRDTDIEELASAPPAELRERLLAASTAFTEAAGSVAEERWHDGEFSRVPGGAALPAVTIPATRRREVEIHHVDLGGPYTRQDWPDDFAAELLDVVTVDHAADGPFVVRATDLGREWSVGRGEGPVVLGCAADLGWWLTGRGAGDGLSCADDQLPTLGPWRRATATAVPTPDE